MTHGQTNLTWGLEHRAESNTYSIEASSIQLPRVIWGFRVSAQTGSPVSSRRLLLYTFRWCQRQLLRVLRRMVRLPKVGQAKTLTNHVAIDSFIETGNACDRTADDLLVRPLARAQRQDLSRSRFHGKSLAWRTIQRFPWSQLVAIAVPMLPSMYSVA